MLGSRASSGGDSRDRSRDNSRGRPWRGLGAVFRGDSKGGFRGDSGGVDSELAACSHHFQKLIRYGYRYHFKQLPAIEKPYSQ